MMLEFSEQLAIVTVVILLLLIGLMWFSLQRTTREVRRQTQKQMTVQADLRALCNAAVQMGERINLLDVRLKAMSQRQQELGNRQDKMTQGDASDYSYDQAIKMARQGRTVEELMHHCNLSRGEAELIAMMHRLEPMQ